MLAAVKGLTQKSREGFYGILLGMLIGYATDEQWERALRGARDFFCAPGSMAPDQKTRSTGERDV
jgi:hypothetical protein